MRVTKKSSCRIIFFYGKSCKPVTRIYRKNKLHDLPQKKITRCDNFFLHVFTAKIKKLHDLTAKKELPILLKMHACWQCAHLWATSDAAPCSEAVGTPQAAGVM